MRRSTRCSGANSAASSPPRPSARRCHVRGGHRRRSAHRRPLRRDDRAHERGMGAARARDRAPSCSRATSSSRCSSATRRASGTRSRELAACAIATGDIERGGDSSSAPSTRPGRARDRSTNGPTPTSGPFVERVLASAAASEFEDARERGRAMTRRAALAVALGPASVRAVETRLTG
jgi:hypothetical protein